MSAEQTVQRRDFTVPGDPGIALFVREVLPADAGAAALPVLLVHGARAPGLASFDLPVPGGSLEDSFYLATGRQLWDASLLRAPTLVLRSGRDFWSRPEDGPLLAAHATDAPMRVVALPEATHFVHLDRPARGRDDFLRLVLAFLRAGEGEA